MTDPAPRSYGQGGEPLPTSQGPLQQAANGLRPRVDTKSVIDYGNLPAPVKYEELQREALMSLKPELFEGFRFDLTKSLNQNFALAHSFFLGNIDVPTNNNQPIKMAIGTYEFGANYVTSQGTMLIGRMTNDGRMTARIKHDLTPSIALKSQMQLASEQGMSQAMLDVDFKGKDWNGQIKYGTNDFYGVNYFQSVTPSLSMGGEAFWLGQQRKSGTGFAARHQGELHVATCQLATTGLINATYIHKVNEKLSLASDFLWNWHGREASASFGYDYMVRQCRLRGKVDTDGKVGALLEERINIGVNFVLSAEIDHAKKDYKFGFGMTLGE
ncbi:hypothetical protein WJX74_008102 [Apatococcus lobatus]|uniref:Mitochondrial import receptor subunit TOM40 n=1 Tax=Apatococcus lobatus TaxID=904363 RepID=A0AAW1S7U0_9CHLO